MALIRFRGQIRLSAPARERRGAKGPASERVHVEVGHIISATVNTEQVRELADPESEGLRHPEILDGKPCIRGTRLSVEFLLELAASGATQEQILAQYPQLTS